MMSSSKSNEGAMMNRVHPERDTTTTPPHSASYYAQRGVDTDDKNGYQLPSPAAGAGAPPSSGALPGLLPAAPSLSKIEHARPKREAFDPVVPLPPPPGQDTPRSKSAQRTWQLLTQVATLIGALNPHDRNVIDIYHAPKVGTSRFMIHPNSKLRRTWDILTAVLVLYVITMIPMMVGFAYVDWSSLNSFNTFIDIYFIVDMVVTVRTGYFANGEVVMDHKAILHHYLRTWFIVDLISNFPLALFVQNSARKSIKIVKLQKLPKLLRVGRLLKYLREYAKYYNLALSFISLAMGLHLFACLWANLFSECYDEEGEPVCEAEELPRMYIQSIHNIVLMFTGIAESTTYAPISHLLNPRENSSVEVYIISIAVFLFGMIFSSFLFGNILSLLMSWDQQSAQFRNRMDIISAEMRHYELPEELQHRVRRNYDYLWINQRAYSDMMLLNQPGISKTLRTTIALHLYKDLVKTVPFFAGSDQRFLGKVCLALETAVYLPGDTIIYCDDIGKEMFIVRKGLVEILIPEPGNPEKRIYLRDGNFFGETALVIDVRRTNTVKAVSICDLNVLNKSAFNEIVAEYPEFGERMKRTVIKRQLDNMNIQSPAEKMKVQNQLNLVVEKSLKQRRMSVSLKTIYRAKKLGDKLKEIADRAAARANVSGSGRRLSQFINNGRPPARKIRPDSASAVSEDEHSRRAPVAPPPSLDTSMNARNLHSQVPSTSSNHQSNRGVGANYTGAVHLPPMATSGSASMSIAQAASGASGAFVPPMLQQQDSSTGGSSKFRLSQIDAVSRKLNKAELTLDLIPTALKEITAMVNQIKRTTDRLNKRIHMPSDGSSDEDDLDLDDFESQINFGIESTEDLLDGLQQSPPSIMPLSEEDEEEMTRRESNSVYTPRGGSTQSATLEVQVDPPPPVASPPSATIESEKPLE